MKYKLFINSKRILSLMFGLFILLLGNVSGVVTDSYFPLKQDTNFSLVISSNNAISCNWTYILYPDGTKINTNFLMTKIGQDFNYTIHKGNFTKLGVNCMGITCSDVDYNYATGSVCRNVTGNGKDNPEGILIFLFIIIFLALLGVSCYLTLYSIGHFMNLDFSIEDLAIDWGVYFVIVGLYFLQDFYLGNVVIGNYLLWFLSIGGILLVFVPICAFLLSIFIGTINKRKLNVQPPQRMFPKRYGI